MHAECEHQFSVFCCKLVCYGLLLFVLRFLREGPRTCLVYNALIFIRIWEWHVRTPRLGTREICVSSTKMGHFVDTIQETAMPSTFSLHIVDGAGKKRLGRMKRGIIVRKRHFYKGVGLVLPKFCVFLKFG